jgi:integrase
MAAPEEIQNLRARVPVRQKAGKAPAPITSLPIERWPASDRAAWKNACTPASRLKRGGTAAHLKKITRDDLIRRYGYFMSFIERSGGLDPNAALTVYVTPDRITRYEAELEKRVSSVTVHGAIYKLRRMAQILNPGADFEWLCDREKDLALIMEPRPKFGRVVYTQVLLQAGLTLMTEADSVMASTSLRRARQFRTGLMVALLACHPIRLKNFVGLALKRTICKVEQDWWIVLAGNETKEKRRDERKIDRCLLPCIELYLEKYRPLLIRGGTDDKLLWVSSRGGPMSYNAIERTIKEVTRATTGVDVCPHLFRTSVASTAAVFAPNIPGLGAAMLHHADPTVTEEHYNRPKTIDATQRFGALIRQYRTQ